VLETFNLWVSSSSVSGVIGVDIDVGVSTADVDVDAIPRISDTAVDEDAARRFEAMNRARCARPWCRVGGLGDEGQQVVARSDMTTYAGVGSGVGASADLAMNFFSFFFFFLSFLPSSSSPSLSRFRFLSFFFSPSSSSAGCSVSALGR
jgi:hypothetical protein